MDTTQPVFNFPQPSSALPVTGSATLFGAPLAGTSLFGGSSGPLAGVDSPYARVLAAREQAPLVDGSRLTRDELAGDEYGAKLLAVRARTSRYGFTDALLHGSRWDFFPFVGQFATVGHDLSAARDASNAFQKMMRGEPLTRNEAIRATLWREEQEMKADGTWGAMFGDIVRKAPAFMLEFGALGRAGQAMRTGLAASAARSAAREATPDAVARLAFLGTTRAAKTGVADMATAAVREAVSSEVARGAFASEALAAKALSASPEYVAKTVDRVAAEAAELIARSSPELTGAAGWAPGLLDKVARTSAERSVRASLAAVSRTGRVSRWFAQAVPAMKDSLVEGLVDFGSWGTETAAHGSAARSFAQAALDYTLYAGARGTALFAPREAVTYGIGKLAEAVTGRAPVRANTLGLQQQAWQRRDPGLMDRAETYGMFLDLLEYVSENSGRGFNNLMRGAGLALAPGLMRAAPRVAGASGRAAAEVIRNEAGDITDVVYAQGLFDPARAAQAGGAVSRYIDRVFGGRALREGVSETRLAAAVHKLEKAGVEVRDTTALQAVLDSGVVGGRLSPEVSAAIGSDVSSFVKQAVREANADIKRDLKIQGLLSYYIADFAGRHNFDATQVFDAFKTMGYDGIVAEMSEERYSDFVSELFGLDADRKDVWDRVTTAVQRLFWPEGGFKQVVAEVLGFAVPAVARAGVARTLAAMGGENDYSQSAAVSGFINDIVRYGKVSTFREGDYIRQVDSQIRRLREAAAGQAEAARRGTDAAGAPLTPQRAADLRESAVRYERGAVRAERLRDAFLASLGEDRSGEFAAPVYSDAQLVAEDAEFERHIHITAEQARRSVAAYRNVVAFAGKMGQLQFKARSRLPDESEKWYRKASHWIVRHAVGAAGFAATGEISFLSADPVRFAAVDRGMDKHLLDVLHDGYAGAYAEAERAARGESEDGTVDLDRVHDRALEAFQPHAERLVASYLAAVQAHTFSKAELRDVALARVAEERGYVVDPVSRRLVGADAATAIPYDDFMAQEGVAQRMDEIVGDEMKVVFDLLSAAGSERADAEVMASDIRMGTDRDLMRQLARIPKDLPTSEQAVLAAVVRYSPAFAGSDAAQIAKRVDPGKRLDDQLSALHAPQGVLGAIAAAASGGAEIASPEDFERVVSESDGKVDDGVLEVVGRAMGYFHDFTGESIRDRNRRVVRYALQAQVLNDPGSVVFSRSANVAESDERISSPGEDVVVARRVGAEWVGTFTRADDNARVVLRAPSAEELAERVAGDDYGYVRRERRVLHTPTRLVYADSALDLIRALNLGAEYRRRMAAVFAQTGDGNYQDPAYRLDSDGHPLYTDRGADRIRAQEEADSALFAAHGRQKGESNAAFYLQPGQSAADEAAMKEARARQQRAQAAWERRNARQKDGRPLGYAAIAEDLVREVGARGGDSSEFENLYGMAAPALRGKFTLDLATFSMKTGGDIYVAIDHDNAQSYSASILSAALKDAMKRSGRRLLRMFNPYIRGFLEDVERLVADRVRHAQESQTPDPEAERRWTAFGRWSVFGVKSRERGVSLDVLDKFIQAFCLYRTEVPDGELWSSLGEHAYLLKELAPDARRSPAFASFCAAADVMLGGSGFDALAPAGARGLGYYYARFAPDTESRRAAEKNAYPDGGAEEFRAEVRRKAKDAFRRAFAGRPPAGQARASAEDAAPQAPLPDGLGSLGAAREAVADAAAEAHAESAGDAVLDQVAADLGGGDTREPPVTPDPGESASEELGEGEELVDEDEDGDDSVFRTDGARLDVQPVGARPEQDENGDRIEPDYREVRNLEPDELAAFAQSLARVLRMTGGDRSSAPSLLRSLVPGLSETDSAQVLSAFEAGTVASQDDVSWVWASEPDEEGVSPDGVEFNNQRNVEVLKSPVIRRLLAIISRVSPATGRDFQPFVEDLRASVAAMRQNFREQMDSRSVLSDAVDYLDRLLNPRANNEFPNACLREAAFSELVDQLTPPPGYDSGRADVSADWNRVQSYVGEFARDDGRGHCVNARAALFLSYLTTLPSNARKQLLQFISSSAPATPLRLSTETVDGKVTHRLRADRRRPGRMSMESVTSAFLGFAGRPAAELATAAGRLEDSFSTELEKARAVGHAGRLASADAYVQTVSRIGLFDVYERVFSGVFGADSTMAVVFASRHLALHLAEMEPARRRRVLGKFTVPEKGLPHAVTDMANMMRTVAAVAGSAPVDGSVLSQAAISLFESGSPSDRHIHRANASVMGSGAWGMLMGAYSEAKPVSVMRGVLDEDRTNKPATSLAITMAGVEPVVQQFLDGTTDDGFAKVCARYMPEYAGRGDFDLGVLRQRLSWPDGTTLVGKNVVKTAYATEVLAGARAAYEDKGTDVLYVPMYSGDHASSIVIQVPFAKKLRDEGLDYDKAAEKVCKWFGLDLFGVDAKRSALTCLEAPGFSLVGLHYDDVGNYAGHGHVRYAVLWNSRPGASNEAFLGSVGMYGYGARRARELARDPALAAQKLHIAAVADDEAFGQMPELTKSLVSAQYGDDADAHGRFTAGSSMRIVMDYAEKLVGGDPSSTAIVADYDSVKMDVVNSKMVGVSVGGKLVPIMEFVLDRAVRRALDAGKDVASVSGAELDALVHDALKTGDPSADGALAGHEGQIPLVNLAKGPEPTWVRLSEVVPAPSVTSVGGGLYAFERNTDHLMAFQVANVAHRAKAETSSAARNYVMDAAAASTVLRTHNADTVAGTALFPGARRVIDTVRGLVENYGLLAAAIASDDKSIELALERNEDWQAMLAARVPTNGPLAADLRRKAYSAWVNEIRTPPMRGLNAALVSNGAWVTDDGGFDCHSRDPMFRDTLRGARTIARADREFYGAPKRVALCNVNCADDTFRYGCYVDEDGILADRDLASYGYIPEDAGLSRDRRVVLTIEAVVTDIADGCTRFSDDASERRQYEEGLRSVLGRYLVDHHGVPLSRRFYLNRRGEYVNRALRVGFLDLFTRVHSARGGYSFDRSAVYTGMTGPDGRTHMYLGGTKFGFSRTPSYNGQIQIVRAGLPVTEVGTVSEGAYQYEDGTASKAQWSPGADAYVAADPYSLKILGNDNDGDKSFLYMLDQRAGAHLTTAEGTFSLTEEDFQGIFDAITMRELTNTALGEDGAAARELLAEWRRRLVGVGILAREVRRANGPDGALGLVRGNLGLSSSAKARLSNAFVLGMFDMNMMLPVFEDAGDRPLYSGTVVDGSRRGDMYRGVKAAPAPKLRREGDPAGGIPEKTDDPAAAWDARIQEPGVLGEKVLDVNDPAKRIVNVSTAAKVQKGGALVSAARGRFVAAARNLHVLRFLGVDAGLNRAIGPDARDFIDALYHHDGPSNMSFDDMKEQICSRLGLLPGMVDTFLYEYFVVQGAPLTDTTANDNVVRFAKAVNDSGHMYYWMARASDPSDDDFHALAAKEKRLPAPGWDGRVPEEARRKDPLASMLYSVMEQEGPFGADRQGELEREFGRVCEFLNAEGPGEVGIGALAWLRKQPEDGVRAAAAGFYEWYRGTRSIQGSNSVAAAVNYTYADPGDAGSESTRRRHLDALSRPNAPRSSGARRMGAAVQLLLMGAGQTAAARGRASVDGFRDSFDGALAELDAGSAPGVRSYEARFLASVSAAPRLREGQRLRAANNARMVGRAAVAFAMPTQTEGSVFNDAGGAPNMYRKCLALAEAVSAARHPTRKGDTVHANVTLDFFWAVETMLDVLGRFTSSSLVHRHLPIADFFRELPSAGAGGYSPDVYGPSASGASRIGLRLPDMSREQLLALQDLVDRIVRGRELDPDGKYGSVPYASTTGLKPGGKPYRVPGDIGYSFSVANMEKMLKFSKSQRGAAFGQGDLGGSAVATGASRDVQKALEILISAFKSLSRHHPEDFPPGFEVRPSALFGQLLPAYAALTDYVDGVPGPGSTSLLAAFPTDFALQEFVVGKMDADPSLRRFLSMAEAVDWGMLPAYDRRGVIREDAPVSELGRRADELSGGVAGSSPSETGARAREALSRFRPRPVDDSRRALGVFDGARGVVFDALANIARTSSRRPFAPAPEGSFAPALTVERPEPQVPASSAYGARGAYARRRTASVPPAPGTTGPQRPRPVVRADAGVPDETVEEIARRMGQVFKLWDGSDVKIAPGKGRFSIEARLHVNRGDPDARAFRTRIDVRVGTGRIPVDPGIRSHLESLAARTGMTVAELEADPVKARRLAAEHRVAGLTTFGFDDRPGAFRMTSGDLEALTANVYLDAADALAGGTAFHEAFHAILGFARAAGVLTEEDIKQLGRKYGKAKAGGYDWFNEEKAAGDYQRILQGEAESVRDGGILRKLFDFIKTLVAALGDVIRRHDSSAYSAQGARNPLTGLVFTGTVYESQDAQDRTMSMDREARVRYAVRQFDPGVEGDELDEQVRRMMAYPEDDPGYVEFMDRFGPVPTGTPDAPAAVLPNPRTDPGLGSAPDEDDPNLGELDAVFGRPDVQPLLRSALDRGGVTRMSVPYGDLDALASSVGAAIRDGFDQESVDRINRLAPERKADFEASQVRRMREAVWGLADLYGVPRDFTAGQERLLFRAMNELAASGYALRGVPGSTGPVAGAASGKTSRTKLAAAVAVASGVLPRDILSAALRDLVAMRDRRSGTRFAGQVLDGRLIPALRALQASADDPTGLFESDGGRDDPNDALAQLHAGVEEVRDADGYRTGYRVVDAGSTRNPHAPANIRDFGDHVDDPDFQRAMGIALDALYMLAATKNMYADLGFRPGEPEDALHSEGVLSPAEMAADLSAAPEQYEDPLFAAVSAQDEPWFSAAAPEAWFDSMVRPSFGGVDVREALQDANRSVAGYQQRITAIRNLHALEYGFTGSPGDALVALDEGYRSGFSWSEGRIVRGERADAADVRRYDKYGPKAKDASGNVVRLDRDDYRMLDLRSKAAFAWMTGSRKLVTGVDGLTFSYDDPVDEDAYSRERVAERIRAGYAGGQRDVDTFLERLDIQLRDSNGPEPYDAVTESGAGRYGYRAEFVAAACAALREARTRVAAGLMRRSGVNDYVIAALDRAGLVSGVQRYQSGQPGPVFVSAAASLDPERVERMFLESATYRKLVAAGRKPEWLSRDAYLKPYMDLVREIRGFALATPFLSDGVGRFFQRATSPVPFTEGDGVTLYSLARAAERDPAKAAQEVRTSFADAFEAGIGDMRPVAAAGDGVVLMARAVFRLPAEDAETVRRRLAAGEYADRVPALADVGTVSDLVAAVAGRLEDMVYSRSLGRRGAEDFGGIETVKDLLRRYRERGADANSPLPNISGLPQDAVHRITGHLPANYQAGHAVQNMVDGLTNALAYRSSLVAMVTSADPDGMPLCYAKPALDAERTTGVPDAVWGAVARWWGAVHRIAYDGARSGVENARAMFDEITEHGRVDRSKFGTISRGDMDDRAVEEFWARKGHQDGESALADVVGGYALGYAKHLFRSTKGLGPRWQRATIHRAWAYSKALSVSFSLFFPIATRLESPIGAVGLMATLGGQTTATADYIREHLSELKGVLGALKPAWITKDFIGEVDFARMLDSNDPFLAEMYAFAGAVGLTMSTPSMNPEEHSRGILQEDLRNLVAFVRGKFGDRAAKKVADISGAVLTKASDKAFTYHLNATKLAVAAQLCMKLQHDAAERGVAFDPVRDMRRYVSYVNAEVGGIDPLQYAWAHPGAQNLMNSLFFSWQWTRGAWEAAGGKVVEQLLFGGHDVTPEERRFMLGRAVRMYAWVAYGLPAVMQVLVKAVGMAMDPDHEDREDEKWWIWENEEKARNKAFDLTPLMRAIAKRFPRYAEFRRGHPVLASVPTAAFMLTKHPVLALAAPPVYTGGDPRNVTEGRHYYMHFAKQFWEVQRWFDEPFAQFASKLAMPVQRVTEGVLGRSLSWIDHPLPWAEMGDAERWLSPTRDSALVNLVKAFVPFSVNGLFDSGDAGLLPVLGPVSMGAGGQDTLRRLKADLSRWVANDRRMFDFGRSRPARRTTGDAKLRRAAGENPVVWRYVSELLANGYSETQARKMVDRAVGDLRSERYRRLEGLLPDTPDGDYDTEEWSRTVRQLQKLGTLAKDANKALVRRLEDSTAWRSRLTPQMRAEIAKRIRDAYEDSFNQRERDY